MHRLRVLSVALSELATLVCSALLLWPHTRLRQRAKYIQHWGDAGCEQDDTIATDVKISSKVLLWCLLLAAALLIFCTQAPL